MTEFYHADRSCSLQAGQVVTTLPVNIADSPAIQAYFQQIYPRGISVHGARYLFDSPEQTQGMARYIETVIEYERRLFFPGLPSRVESMFGCGTLQEARVFRNTYQNRQPNGEMYPSIIWRVECEAAFRADIQLLNLPAAMFPLSFAAQKYWRGEMLEHDPVWEWILPLPVHVVEAVERG